MTGSAATAQLFVYVAVYTFVWTHPFVVSFDVTVAVAEALQASVTEKSDAVNVGTEAGSQPRFAPDTEVKMTGLAGAVT